MTTPITTPDDVLDVAPELAPLNVPRAAGRPSPLAILIDAVSLLVRAEALGDASGMAGRYLVAHCAVMQNPQFLKLGPAVSVSAGGISRTRAMPVSTAAALSTLDATGYGQIAQALCAGLGGGPLVT